MKNSGFKNEIELIKALNGKKISDLNQNLRKLLIKSFYKYSSKIHCQLQAGKNKSDLQITIGEESHTYSVKKGRGNSIHQEALTPFLEFLESEHQLSKKTKEQIQRFIFADGTSDGTGEIKSRLSSKKFKKKHPKIIKEVQAYFDQHKKALIERFLINGVESNSSAEFIYYGTVKKGTVCRSQDVLNWVASHKSKGTLNIGKLTFQAWNRNLKGKQKAEKKRGVIQIKWGGLKKDIKKIAKINLGKRQEIEFVKELNKKINLNYWETLDLNPQNHYAIRVKYQKYGKLNQRKIWAKADAFIAKGFMPTNYLKLNDYFLNEDDVKKFKLIPIKITGISIKKENSQHYSISKMSPSTFQKLFNSNILAAGASLYYRKKKKLIHNKNILKGWGITEEEFFDYYSFIIKKEVGSLTNPNCQACLKKIKRYAKKEISNIINKKQTISDFIFMGLGNFKEPFTASWIYEHAEFKKNHKMPFTVTTGSGRSNGKYTIVIKPK